jgi:hypothetical protein
VLAVGIAKVSDATYYVINDSGFGLTDPLTRLKGNTKIGPDTIGACTASLKRNPPDKNNPGPWGYGTIMKYRVLGGLQSLSGLTLTPPPF